MRTTQKKGDIAKARALSTFTDMGYDVAILLTESASYDIIVDTNEGLKRISVKYAKGKEVDLRNIHQNSKGYVVKKTKENSYDWLYILADNKEYLIKECLSGRRSIRVSESYRM